MTQEHETHEDSVNVEDKGKRTFSEELEVGGRDLVDKVQEIIKQGNVRKVVIKSADDRVLLETSLTVSAVAGGALALTGALVPVAVLGVIAAAVSKVKIEIIREVTDDDEVIEVNPKKKVEIQVEDDSE